MTEILAGMSPLEQAARKTKHTPEQAERAAIRELVKAARARGDELTGPDGLLKSITKQVLETALAEEMSRAEDVPSSVEHVQNLQSGAHSQRQQPLLRGLRDRGHRDRDLLREHQRRRRRSCW